MHILMRKKPYHIIYELGITVFVLIITFSGASLGYPVDVLCHGDSAVLGM